jgi:hypothetical protein
MNDPAQIIKYLDQIRRDTQWFENKTVLAPGDRTEYMRKVERAAIAQIGIGIPGVNIIEAVAAQSNMGDSLSVTAVQYEWVAVLNERVFVVEGESGWSEIEDNLRTGVMLGGFGPGEPIVLSRIPKTRSDLEDVLSNNDPVSARIMGTVRAAWSQHIEGPTLNEATTKSGARPQSSRRI